MLCSLIIDNTIYHCYVLLTYTMHKKIKCKNKQSLQTNIIVLTTDDKPHEELICK